MRLDQILANELQSSKKLRETIETLGRIGISSLNLGIETAKDVIMADPNLLNKPGISPKVIVD
jgi:hypothetical protein